MCTHFSQPIGGDFDGRWSAAATALTIQVARAGKPKPPPPPPPPAIVQYELTQLDSPGPDWDTRASDMNDLGTIVGYASNRVSGDSRAVMWMMSGELFDLNTNATWTDMSWGAPALGWTAIRARKVKMF